MNGRGGWGLWFCLAAVVVSVAAAAQEVGPDEVVDLTVPIRAVDRDGELPPLVQGSIAVVPDCAYCYLHRTQYRIVVPDGAVGLTIELRNISDPAGDIDLIVREGTPVTEDEDTYYYTFRTYGDAGEERLELPEAGVSGVAAGEYYIGIVSYVEDGTAFELRGAAYVSEIEPPAVDLLPNTTVSGTLGPGGDSASDGTQYRIIVPAGATMLAVHAATDGENIDLFVGERPIDLAGAERPAGRIAMRSSGPDELLLLSSPDVGSYWIVVANPTPSSIRYRLTAMPLPTFADVAPGETIEATVGWEGGLIPVLRARLATERGLLGPMQYRIVVPADATGIELRLRGMESRDLGLHMRYELPVVVDGGEVVADLSSIDGAEKSIRLRDAFLRPGGVLHVAIERFGDGEKAFALDVRVSTE